MRGGGQNITHFSGFYVRERVRGRERESKLSFDDP